MAELRVGHELAVEEHAATDARAERDHEHDTFAILTGTEAELGEARGVGIVEEQHRHPQPVGEQLVGVGPDPFLVDVGGRHRHAVLHHRREGRSDGTVPVEVVDHLGHDVGDRLRSGGLRREYAVALAREVAFLHVDRRTLDAGATDVDA